MAIPDMIINKFRGVYFSSEIKLPVQVSFIRKLSKKHAEKNLSKKSMRFNTSSYPLETFYKPIHYCFDVTKIK